MPDTSSSGTARRSLSARVRIGYRFSLAVALLLIAVVLRPFLALFALFGVPRWWPAAVWFRAFLPVIGVRVVTRGRPVARPALLAANHVSWLDIAALGTRLGGGFVSKAEVAKWPLIGWFATGTGTVYLSRGAHQTQITHATLQARLKDGYSVAIFPEGTTTAHRLPHLFHSRLFAAAIDNNVPVQPVAIHYPPAASDRAHEQHPAAPYVNEMNLMTHLLGVLACPRLTVEIIYGAPIQPAGKDRRELAGMTREAICAALGAPGHTGKHAVSPARARRRRAASG